MGEPGVAPATRRLPAADASAPAAAERPALLVPPGQALGRLARTQDLARALEAPDPVDGLATLIRRGFDLLDAYGELLVMVLASPPGTYARGRSDYDTVRAQLGELLQRGVDRGEFRADLNVDYAVAVFGGLFTPRALPRLRATQPLAAIAEASVGFFLAGVGSSRIPAAPAAETRVP